MVTRRRRQRLPSPVSQRRSTRRRDVYPPLPLCPYLAQPPRRGSAKAGIAIPSPPRPLPWPPSRKEQPAALIRAPPAPSRRPEGRRGAGALGTPVEGVAELMDELGALAFPDLWRLQSRFGAVLSVRGVSLKFSPTAQEEVFKTKVLGSELPLGGRKEEYCDDEQSRSRSADVKRFAGVKGSSHFWEESSEIPEASKGAERVCHRARGRGWGRQCRSGYRGAADGGVGF
ncbi:Dynamin-3 [Manis pentadactyla]|nr:Dynamin-3 [Manis pentadactyla]